MQQLSRASPSDSAALSLDGLNVAVDNRTLLTNVRFDLEPGAALALVGPSGSGKSTLLRSIAVLHGNGAGLRLGHATPGDLGHAAWRRRVSYAHPSLRFSEASVEDVLRRPFEYRTSGQQFDVTAAASHLKALGLSGTLKRDPRDLSSGELQRVALIRALSHGPSVALLDEPFAHLDSDTRQTALDWLGTWQDKGTSLLIASHVQLPFTELDIAQFTPGDDA